MTSFASILDSIKAPAPPASARVVHGAAMADGEGSQLPSRGSQVSNPIAKEQPMPRGVYDRTKTRDAAPPEAKEPKKRGGRPKKKAAADMGALATEALIAAGRHLAATVREGVELEEAPQIVQALASHALAEKILEAATA